MVLADLVHLKLFSLNLVMFVAVFVMAVCVFQVKLKLIPKNSLRASFVSHHGWLWDLSLGKASGEKEKTSITTALTATRAQSASAS